MSEYELKKKKKEVKEGWSLFGSYRLAILIIFSFFWVNFVSGKFGLCGFVFILVLFLVLGTARKPRLLRAQAMIVSLFV